MLEEISKDKLLHGFYGGLLYAFLLFIFSEIIAFTIVLFIAVFKEIYDFFSAKHTADIFDIIATISIPYFVTMASMFKYIYF